MHGDIRKVVAAILEAPPGARADEMTLTLHLKGEGAVTDGLIADVMIDAGLPVHWDFLIGRVREGYQGRKLDAALLKARTDLQRGEAPGEVCAGLSKVLTDAASAQGLTAASEIADEVMAEIRLGWESPGGVTGLRTGFKKLDEVTRGLQPGQLIVVGARPGLGKTSLALNIARSVALGSESKAVFVASLEMSPRDLLTRVVSDLSSVPLGAKHSPVREREIAGAVERIRLAPLHFHAENRRLWSIIGGIRAAKIRHDIRLAVVDYLQLVEPEKRTDNRANDVASISGALKAVAMEIGIPVLALSQLNRESLASEPCLHHLRESGAIEQDADIVLLLHRLSEDETQGTFPYKVIVAKNRSGWTGEFDLQFARVFCRFRDPSYENDSERN